MSATVFLVLFGTHLTRVLSEEHTALFSYWIKKEPAWEHSAFSAAEAIAMSEAGASQF